MAFLNPGVKLPIETWRSAILDTFKLEKGKKVFRYNQFKTNLFIFYFQRCIYTSDLALSQPRSNEQNFFASNITSKFNAKLDSHVNLLVKHNSPISQLIFRVKIYCLFCKPAVACTINIYDRRFYDRILRSNLERKLRPYDRNHSYRQLRLATASSGQLRLAKTS